MIQAVIWALYQCLPEAICSESFAAHVFVPSKPTTSLPHTYSLKYPLWLPSLQWRADSFIMHLAGISLTVVVLVMPVYRLQILQPSASVIAAATSAAGCSECANAIMSVHTGLADCWTSSPGRSKQTSRASPHMIKFHLFPCTPSICWCLPVVACMARMQKGCCFCRTTFAYLDSTIDYWLRVWLVYCVIWLLVLTARP